MKTKSLFFSSLIAASAMSSIPAFADGLTVNGTDVTVSEDTTYEFIRVKSNDLKISAIVDVTGNAQSVVYSSATFFLRDGGGTSTTTISSGGVLNLANAKVSNRDGAGCVVVDGGEANFGQGLDVLTNWGSVNVTMNSGSLNIGEGGIAFTKKAAGSLTVTLKGGTVGSLADSWSTTQAITLGGDVAFDTTKKQINTGAAASSAGTASTITLGGNVTQTAGTLTVTGTGTLDLSGATVSLVNAIKNEAPVKVNSSTVFILNDSLKSEDSGGYGDSGVYTLIANNSGNITDWSTLTLSSFRHADGTTFTGRSLADVTADGKVTITEGVAANLVWNGGESGTWDTTSQNWTNGTTADHFCSKDNVTFSAGQNATVTFSENLTAGKVSIAGNVTLASSITGTLTGEIVVADGGTLTVSKSYADSGASAIRGSLTIQSGGKASFTTGDVCGWSATASSRLDAITVDSGGTLEINRNGNETFRGTLTLNGTLTSGTSGGSDTAWDLFGGSAKIVTTVAGAKIDSGVNLRFRQNNSEINVGSDASLEIASVISDTVSSWREGNGLLRKTGTGTLTLSGVNTYSGGTNIEAGTVVAKNASALGTGNISISADAELKLDIGSDTTMTQGTGTISGAQNQTAKLTIASGKLVLTSASNDFKGTVDILDGGTLELNSGAKLLTTYSNTSYIWIRSGGELRMTSFDYNALGASPDYAKHRQIDGGRISITGETSSSGQGFTVTSNGGEFLMEQSGQTLTLNGNANSNIIALNGALKIGGAGDIVINKDSAQVAIAGNGSLEKVGAGTLTINSAGNTYMGGTTVTKGKLIVGSSNALGTADRSVRIAGGQLEVSSGITLAQTNIEIALSDAYSTEAAILGEGALAEGTTITLTAADKAMVALLTENTKEYQIFASGTSLASNFSVNSFTLDKEAWADWKISGYDADTGKVTLEMIPEPSAFGLLAGVGALALVVARRRRRSK